MLSYILMFFGGAVIATIVWGLVGWFVLLPYVRRFVSTEVELEEDDGEEQDLWASHIDPRDIRRKDVLAVMVGLSFDDVSFTVFRILKTRSCFVFICTIPLENVDTMCALIAYGSPRDGWVWGFSSDVYHDGEDLDVFCENAFPVGGVYRMYSRS